MGRALGEPAHGFIAYLGRTTAWKADEVAENHYFAMCGDLLVWVDTDGAEQMIKILNKCPGCESGELKLSCCHANAAQEHVVKSGDIYGSCLIILSFHVRLGIQFQSGR